MTLVDLGRETITKRIDAKQINWKNKEKKWSINNYSIRFFDQEGKEKEVSIGKQDTLIDLGFFLKIYISKQGNQTNLIFSL